MEKNYPNHTWTDQGNGYIYNIIDPAVHNLLDIIFNCFFINIVALLGIIGNIINVIVLLHHDVKTDTTTILLLSLAVSDLLFNITIPIRRIRCLVARFDPVAAMTVNSIVVVYIRQFNNMMVANSCVLIGTISLERFVAVIFPFKVSTLISPLRVKVVVCTIYLINVILIIPMYSSIKLDWYFDVTYNTTIARLAYTEMIIQNATLFRVLYFILTNCIIWGMPWTLVPLFNIAICLKIVRSGKYRKKISSVKDVGYDIKIVKMLIVLSSTSFVLFAPPTILDSIGYFVPYHETLSNLRDVISSVNECLYTLNASINFVIYVCMSKKFSNTIKKLMF